MSLHPQTPSSLASFKSRLVIPFWYRLIQVILEKRPLNGCCSSRSHYLIILVLQFGDNDHCLCIVRDRCPVSVFLLWKRIAICWQLTRYWGRMCIALFITCNLSLILPVGFCCSHTVAWLWKSRWLKPRIFDPVRRPVWQLQRLAWSYFVMHCWNTVAHWIFVLPFFSEKTGGKWHRFYRHGLLSPSHQRQSTEINW